MNLTRLQKISIAFFICSLLPAYLIANWRHAENLTAITERYERERNLHLSTDKLLKNCALNEKKENEHYSANHQICTQGEQEHQLSGRLMELLAEEKANNDRRWYRNFALSVSLLNLLGLAIRKAYSVLTREETTLSLK